MSASCAGPHHRLVNCRRSGDEATLRALREFLDMIADSPNAAPVLKTMDKLVSLMSKDQAERLGTASRQMQIVPSPRLTGIVDAGDQAVG